jgi:cyclophilin family peptidyl-prolyl cis-trans isomerase
MVHRACVALLAVLWAASCPSQDSKPDPTLAGLLVALARGTDADALGALGYLEDARSADVASWRALLARPDDPGFRARVIRGLGRVGEPALAPLLAEVLGQAEGPWTPECRRAAALAVGLFGDPALLPPLASRAGSRDVVFACALMNKIPPDALAGILAGLPAAADAVPVAEPGESTFTDPVEAALRWGATVDGAPFAELARAVLVAGDATPARRRAAADFFARSKARAPADARPALLALLSAGDPEVAGLAARALAKSEGAGDAEAGAIQVAFVGASAAVARVDEARALAALANARATEVLAEALVLAQREPAVLRTVLEALKAAAPKMPEKTRAIVAATAAGIVSPEDDARPAPADVRAAAVSLLAVVDPARFRERLPSFRLAAEWPVRAAAAAALADAGDDAAVARALADPDRRVRIATLEALARKPAEPPAGGPSALLEPLFTRLSASPNHWHAPKTADPVEISTLASAVAARDRDRAPLFVEAFRLGAVALPDHEVEPLQAVLDLAASLKSEPGNLLLRRYLSSPEISLRKRAKALLSRNGVAAEEDPPRDERTARTLLDASLRRARRVFENPLASAVIETNRGNVTISLFPSDAPGTVENFLALAKSGFYDGIAWHRVVPAFVAQAGCPRGDGWGGPGWTIRCEVSDRTYRRGSVGMALAGKDTGGSQFFICHRAVPHLDGRYTLFGQVTSGMDVVDRLGQDDWIVRVREP